MPLLATRGLCKYFKQGTINEVRAVHEVSLTIDAGQFVLLTGPSGSGKSTLLSLLGALARPSAGQVFFEDRDLGGCSDLELTRVRRRIGYVFQNFSLIPGLPVWENITYPLIPRGVGLGHRHQRASELLAGLGLAGKLLAYPEELSGGEQQRVALARALAGRPSVLMADEPTSNLDQAAAQALAELFRKIHSQGTTVILSSHDPWIGPLATTVSTLDSGRLVSTCSQPQRQANRSQ
jgi:putative ABC transport system ATP-binding protein